LQTSLTNIQPIYDLQPGLDFRLPQYRRKVFLDFYKFHTKYRGHAGAVYYAIPHIIQEFKLNKEQAFWLCFINGCSQNIVTSYIIFKKFNSLHKLNLFELKEWFYNNYKLFGWDTDRRYFKNSFIQCVENYLNLLNGKTQAEFFNNICNSNNAHVNFKKLWLVVNNDFLYFGRLSAFSYIEYLNIIGLNVECNELFLDDLKGSKSHRNGLCKVLGRDDLDWTKKNNVTYTDNIIEELKLQGELLLKEAKEYIDMPFVNYFTLETTLCCYKGWHRVNRRYPNVYNDMFYDRITHAENKWKTKFDIFHQARKKYLPKYLRCEHNPSKLKLCKEKQNHYRLTGQVIMMEKDFPYYINNFRTNTLWQ
tara:strand:- start:26578 stop:27666 length:1089 start_codon:yes stop_codon:yes gene_type:complete